MSRCRTLLKENEELGKQISQGRIAKLEGEIALEKKLVEEMRVAQDGEGLVFVSSCKATPLTLSIPSTKCFI